MKRTVLLPLLATSATFAQANLVVNGDFEAGNSGFTPGYTYVPITSQGSLYPESVYSVDTNANKGHNAFASFGDHTTGSGLYMIVNGAGSKAVAVWSSTVSVVAGQEYDFSAWVANAYPVSPAGLTFRVDGQILNATPYQPTGLGEWNQISSSFIAAATGTVTVDLLNSNTELSGNDFALDDIAVEAVPEPASMAALGLGALALVRKRKKA